MELLDRMLKMDTASKTSCRVHGPGECFEGCPHAYSEFDPELARGGELTKVAVMIKVAEDHEGYSVVAVPKRGQEILLCSILAGDMLMSVEYAQAKTKREWMDNTEDYEWAAEYLNQQVRKRLDGYGLHLRSRPDDMLWDALLTITMPGPGIMPPAVMFDCPVGFRTEV